MRAIFGGLSLLVVLGIVAIMAMKQLKAVGTSTAAAAAAASLPQAAATVRAQSEQLQQRVQDDLARAMAQGADARASEPGQ